MKGRSDRIDVQRGARIRALRKALNLNQAELAERIGVDQSTVSDIERGSSFSADLLMRMAESLGTSPTILMKGQDETYWPFRHVAVEQFMALADKDRDFIEGILVSKLEDLSVSPSAADIERFKSSHVRMTKPPQKRRAA